MFWGRQQELIDLKALKTRKSASLVVVSGRRRIGKSSLIQNFAKEFPTFIEFQGLAPRPGMSNELQLDNFAKQFQRHFSLPKVVFEDWSEAFFHLAKNLTKGRALLFLDEISWMGGEDRDFAGKLKIAWDTHFKQNEKLMLVLCGSVSSWIEENILADSGFVGRISLVIRLQELELNACNKFWGAEGKRVADFEKLRLLSVTGGVPEYLQQINTKQSADENIRRLCFTPGGYLFEDFGRIFSDIFGRRSEIYRKLLMPLIAKKLGPREIAEAANTAQNSDLTKYLSDLELSGFIARDFAFKADGTTSKLSRYRIGDNYLRFYLKYIAPNESKIKSGLYRFATLDSLGNWQSICGLQFENLVVNRLSEVIKHLNLSFEQIVTAGPYFQTKTAKSEPCQIDLMIVCKSGTIYVCEIKFRKKIGIETVREVESKLKKLKIPKRNSVRPILIYAGELEESLLEREYFDRTLDVSRLLA